MRKFFTKRLLASLTAAFLIFTIFDFYSFEPDKTLAYTIKSNSIVTLSSRALVSQSLATPFKTFDTFISEEQKSNFAFTSVGISWDEIKPVGTHIEVEMKFNENGKWTDWIELEEEEDPFFKNREAVKKYAMASSNGAESLMYRVKLFGDGKNSPVAKNFDLTFIKAAKEISAKPIFQTKYASDSPITDIKYVALTSDSTAVISRSQWGANESYRYMENNDSDPQLIELDEDFYEKNKDELKYSRVVKADDKGNKYKWPLEYPEKVSKFIVHHTATSSNLDDPKQAIRDIYYYHAVSRGWGDIGYNYIIDPKGKIYEGRFGGESVIGAHSGPGNHGSIGIAILGNYQENTVPEIVVSSLSEFINKKAKIHNIKPDGSSEFRGEIRPNIFGHRDIMNTTCPGDFLYKKLDLIRTLASKVFNEKEKFVKDYDYQNKSDVYYTEIKPTEEIEITLKFQNIGKKDWDSKTYIVVDQNPEFENVLSFPTKTGSVLAKVQEDGVKSGKTGTFKFKIKAGKTGKAVSLNIAPVINGSQKLSDYTILPVVVQQPVYDYQFLEGKFPPQMMKSDEEFDGWVKVKNEGNVTWYKDGENKVSLKNETNTFSSFLSSEKVKPGEIGEFKFKVKAPVKTGKYVEALSLSMTGAKWSSKDNISFSTTVYSKDYDSEVIQKIFNSEWQQGKDHYLSIKLENTGSKNWDEKNLKTVFMKDPEVKIKSVALSPIIVKPGETAILKVSLQTNASAALGEKLMFVRPKINKAAITRLPIEIRYKNVAKSNETVKPPEQPVSNVSNDPMRVKISFPGNPEITGNDSVEIYSGNDLITTVDSAATVKVSRESGKLRVDADGVNFIKTEPIRIKAKNNGILKINNFDRTDKEFRGILEVREVDGVLNTINELDLEDYLKGIAEEPNNEEFEKIKAVIVAARTYAKFYMERAEKFPGKPYNLDDDPAVSQKYLGYGYEKRAPNVVKAVDMTAGEVVTYDGELVKTPFFSQSDGIKTKSAKDVWGWTNTPYLVSVDDSYCKATEFRGHGVGLSGCGAKAMAQQGFDYIAILKHYYTGVEITKK